MMRSLRELMRRIARRHKSGTAPPPRRRVVTVLLTATIDPKNVPFMAVTDPRFRLQECVEAARAWIKVPGLNQLVWCENSGYVGPEMDAALAGAAKSEILTFDGQWFDRSLGKGYGELLTIRHALERSELIASSDLVLKVNARYHLGCAAELLEALASSDAEVVADLKRNLTWGDTRVVAASPRFWKERLAIQQDDLNDSAGFYLEHALARAIHAEIAGGGRWAPLPLEPEIVGRSGTGGASYRTDLAIRLARSARRKAYLRVLGLP